MSAVIGQEAYFLCHAIVLGAGLLLLYDLFRILRRLLPHGKVPVALEDIGYWMLSGALIFRMLYTHNRGIIRWFAVGGVMLGMVLYGWLFSEAFVEGAVGLCRWIWKKIRRPVLFAAKKIRRVYRFAGAQCKKITKMLKTLLHNTGKVCKIKHRREERKRSGGHGRKNHKIGRAVRKAEHGQSGAGSHGGTGAAGDGRHSGHQSA